MSEGVGYASEVVGEGKSGILRFSPHLVCKNAQRSAGTPGNAIESFFVSTDNPFLRPIQYIVLSVGRFLRRGPQARNVRSSERLGDLCGPGHVERVR